MALLELIFENEKCEGCFFKNCKKSINFDTKQGYFHMIGMSSAGIEDASN
jgi:hypothetical protein